MQVVSIRLNRLFQRRRRIEEGPDRLRQGDRGGLGGSDETRQGAGEGVYRQENENCKYH